MSKPSLSDTVARYNRKSNDRDTSGLEFEIRFQSVDFIIFKAILESLVSKKIDVSDGVISHTINSIMRSSKINNRRSQSYDNHQSHIRQIKFNKGEKVADAYMSKQSIMQPIRVNKSFALSYNITLSIEEENTKAFNSDSSAIVRVKARCSFLFPTDSPTWRFDLTVVRQITGADVNSSLSKIVNSMFRTRPNMTPENMLSILQLDNAGSPLIPLYKYEVEIEHVGDPTTLKDGMVSDIVNALLGLTRPEYIKDAAYQTEIYYVASKIVKIPGLLRKFEYEFGLKKLLPSVSSLTRASYRDIFPPVNYYVTDKADGLRSIVSIRQDKCFVLADKLYEFTLDDDNSKLKTTILDAELIIHQDTNLPNEKILKIYVFDAIIIDGEDITGLGIGERLQYIESAIDTISKFGIFAEAKPYVRLSNEEELENHFKTILNYERPYETDGLIIVEPGKSYINTRSFKWKPLKNNTIDFLAKRCPNKILGRPPFVEKPKHTLYFLFVGINPEMFYALGLRYCPGYKEIFSGNPLNNKTGGYFPIQFSPSDSPFAYIYYHPDTNTHDINDKVIELRCIGKCDTAGTAGLPNWEFERIREDRIRELLSNRYFGNDYSVAESTWLNYIDPFPVEELWTGPLLDYFMNTKSGIYRAQTGFISFAKTEVIKNLPSHEWVIDLGAGRGADLGRYIAANVENLIAVDQDRAALSELIRRKYSFAKTKRGKQKGMSHKMHTAVHIAVIDLNVDADENATSIRQLPMPIDGVNAIVCNLAVHYFAESVAKIKNFVKLCANLVVIGGTVTLTAMFGDKVHEKLIEESIEEGSSWNRRQGDILKFSIERRYSSDSLESAGQRIAVLHPFSNGDLYEEYLVNTEVFQREFALRGFELIASNTFDSKLQSFARQSPNMHKLMTPYDIEYISLYGELIFRKVKSGGRRRK